MSRAGYYLCGTATGWKVYAIDASGSGDGVPAAPIAEDLAVKDVLHQLKPDPGSQKASTHHVVIGLPATWCLCATIPVDGLPSGNADRFEQALAFRLEAALPVTAEDCAIGFLGSGPKRLGVAVMAKRLTGLVHALEDAGHVVEAIVPRSLLVAQAWQSGGESPATSEPSCYYWHDLDDKNATGPGQLLHLSAKREPRWRTIDNHPTSLAQQIAIDSDEDQPHWFATADAKETLRASLSELDVDADSIGTLSIPVDAELETAQCLIDQPHRAWVNLARGPLAPRHQWRRLRTPVIACVIAAMVLLTTAIGVLFWRAQQYDQIAAQYDSQVQQAYVQVMPGQVIPTSPIRRLQTKLKQLRGEQGLAAGDALHAAPVPALNLIHDALAALPADLRFAITDMRLEDDELRLVGQARSHSEADQLANALRQSLVYVVEPPSTDKLPEGGVRFTLQARYLQPPPASDEEVPNAPVPPSLAERTGTEAHP